MHHKSTSIFINKNGSQSYEEQKFNISTLKNISQKQVDEHLKLYAGYVKHTNLIREKIAELSADEESTSATSFIEATSVKKASADKENSYIISELRRRFSFEFDGMRMHEYFFEQFESEQKNLSGESVLSKTLSEKYGSVEQAITHFKKVGMTRGIGWTVLYYDNKAHTPHITWVGDHELGQLAGLPIILAMDMWEHSFMIDYLPSEKAKYIEAFFENLNWSVAEERFKKFS